MVRALSTCRILLNLIQAASSIIIQITTSLFAGEELQIWTIALGQKR